MPKKAGSLSALAPWYGAKRSMADTIVEAIGPHRCYWEPFCGSMAVLLAKEPASQETANDRHGDLVNLARVIRCEDSSPRLDWRLRRTLPAEALFRESLAALRAGPAPDVNGPPSIDRAYHFFLCSWLGVNGVAGTKRVASSFARRFNSGGGAAGGRFAAAVDSLPAWHDRLRRVEIYSGCGLELCERIEDRAGTAVYADPPYLVKGDKYLHDFAPADHERLASALRRFKLTRVVVSYYDRADLAALYPGWEVRKLAARKNMANSFAHHYGRIEAPEVLIINRPGS